MWSRIADTIAQEFSDVPDIEQVTRILVRLLLAALLGGALGWEREHSGQAAGLRTHMLVSMGAALFVLAPGLAGMDIADLSRVIQGVVAGIGFLCAGAIVKAHSPHTVHGLTTAAGIWLTAAIGMTAGLGRETMAVLATVLALIVLGLLPRIVEPRRD
ncbi:methyltransferase [Rubrivivax gelatinosus]|uniref:Protein MgtC n=1 Tax=Rubrivivax gelatinosus TaxID=28068 RepID=A0ABS1DZL3_RUBGE|nr:methyltransferase [Rubrivivax gelatinosus]MBK1715552.1 methyltransferase [Rubrivivax gelatinosus]